MPPEEAAAKDSVVTIDSDVFGVGQDWRTWNEVTGITDLAFMIETDTPMKVLAVLQASREIFSSIASDGSVLTIDEVLEEDAKLDGRRTPDYVNLTPLHDGVAISLDTAGMLYPAMGREVIARISELVRQANLNANIKKLGPQYHAEIEASYP